MKILNKWEITKIEKTEAEKTTEETEKKGENKKMKKSTKGGLIALTVAVVGAGVYGVKTYLDSRKEDSYASLDQASDVEDEVEDLDQEETTDDESDN